MGMNLSMEGRKFLLYLLDLVLWRQLKGRYWLCRWHAHQQQVGRSGWLTLIIKHSNELFYCVDEDGELSGFGFMGRSKGWSGWEQMIKHGHGSWAAMKNKVCSVVDLF